MKRRPSEWLKWVKLYVNDGVPITKIANKYHLDVSELKYRIKLYQVHLENIKSTFINNQKA